MKNLISQPLAERLVALRDVLTGITRVRHVAVEKSHITFDFAGNGYVILTASDYAGDQAVMNEAANKIEELRSERDTAREHAATLEGALRGR